MTKPLQGIGIWSGELRYGDRGAADAAATELDELGFDALWIPDVGGNLFDVVESLLAATNRTTIATGILNLWMHSGAETAAQHARMVSEHGDRFLVGIGVSHAPLIDMAEAGRYNKPLQHMRRYLDALDAAEVPLAAVDRVLAALGPKMLELARTRTAGAHPYLVTPEHTAQVRSAFGAGPQVLPEQAVVLETDPAVARAIARVHLSMYLGLPNYANNWRRLGYTDDDIANGGSDRLVDALVVWGDEATIAARIAEHRSAGADHVCLQLLSSPESTAATQGLPLEGWRRLAAALLSK
jgi:probable F420-dependent oxidoreductase